MALDDGDAHYRGSKNRLHRTPDMHEQPQRYRVQWHPRFFRIHELRRTIRRRCN